MKDEIKEKDEELHICKENHKIAESVIEQLELKLKAKDEEFIKILDEEFNNFDECTTPSDYLKEKIKQRIKEE